MILNGPMKCFVASCYTPPKCPYKSVQKGKKIPLKAKRWFDQECQVLKRAFNSISKERRINLLDENISKKQNLISKTLRSTCSEKKIEYWKDLGEKLESPDKDNNFWDVWQSFDDKPQKENLLKLIDGSKWENYYGKLFCQNEEPKSHLDELAKSDHDSTARNAICDR